MGRIKGQRHDKTLKRVAESEKQLEGQPEIARGAKGHFGPGNAGKPKGAISWATRTISEAAKELYEQVAPEHFRALFAPRPKPSVGLLQVRQRAVEWLAERAYGKTPLTVRLGIDPGSPEGLLLAMAGQTIPGIGSSEETTT